MPLLTNEQVIMQYYEQVKDQYPDIEYKAFEKICKNPFNYAMQSMRSDSLPFILLKNFGKIRPYEIKLKRMIYSFRNKPEQHYQDRLIFLEKYLEELKDYDDNKNVRNRTESTLNIINDTDNE